MDMLTGILIAVVSIVITSSFWSFIDIRSTEELYDEVKDAWAEIDRLKADNDRMMRIINEYQINTSKNWRSKKC